MAALFATFFLPLLGFAAVMFIDREQVRAIRFTTISFSLVTFAISLLLWAGFDHHNGGFQYQVDTQWIASLDAGFRIGLDGMSLLLVMLTTFIMPIAILSSFGAIYKREKITD